MPSACACLHVLDFGRHPFRKALGGSFLGGSLLDLSSRYFKTPATWRIAGGKLLRPMVPVFNHAAPRRGCCMLCLAALLYWETSPLHSGQTGTIKPPGTCSPTDRVVRGARSSTVQLPTFFDQPPVSLKRVLGFGEESPGVGRPPVRVPLAEERSGTFARHHHPRALFLLGRIRRRRSAHRVK